MVKWRDFTDLLLFWPFIALAGLTIQGVTLTRTGKR